MPTYKKESHIRSILKGVSWRIVATTDTIVVVLLVTCLNGQCSLENAIKIGALEFFIKFFVYYLHERVWQNILQNKEVNKKQTLHKTISWRIIATTMTFLISGTILETFDEIAMFIALTELFTKFVLYYLHERLWLKLPLGKVRQFFIGKKN
ncbi:DUF2061 domain-containing protein [Winogradskyella tangerina]|uniref:DUF2061 domain-containing protein n=1 Tax=Winogradskyella tangerina TaxID=2023240 RepID=UPI000DBE1CCA|nr:DUF2061 domain-containing protein [Winogradskyella tangerina]